jgi:hypothetical protein
MVFLVFEPKTGRSRTLAEADQVTFLREKFSWPALFFGPLWMIWHRLWLAFALWLVASIAIATGIVALGLSESVVPVALLVSSLIAAFEATGLRRRKLLRQGLREAAVVIAEDREAAERRFFAQWVQAEPAATPTNSPAPSALPPLKGPIVGLFPEPGAMR